MELALLSAGFQSLPLLPTSKLGPSGADSWVGGFVYILEPCGSLQWTLLWGWQFLPLPPQPPQVFSIRGLRLYFPALKLWVARVCLAPQLFLLVYPHTNVGLPSLQSAASPVRQLGCRTSIQFDFLEVLVVFVFKFVVVLLLVVRGGTVCLPMPPSWPEVLSLIFFMAPWVLKEYHSLVQPT